MHVNSLMNVFSLFHDNVFIFNARNVKLQVIYLNSKIVEKFWGFLEYKHDILQKIFIQERIQYSWSHKLINKYDK